MSNDIDALHLEVKALRNLVKHLLAFHEERICEECEGAGSREVDVYGHVTEHACEVCGEKFSNGSGAVPVGW